MNELPQKYNPSEVEDNGTATGPNTVFSIPNPMPVRHTLS